MCTILLKSETLPAEKRSRKDTQKAVDPLTLQIAEDRRQMKSGVIGSPTGHIYVWLDNMRFGNSDKTGFYYVRYRRSMLWMGTTAYAHPALIVQKSQLRPDQVEYMDRKCRETLIEK